MVPTQLQLGGDANVSVTPGIPSGHRGGIVIGARTRAVVLNEANSRWHYGVDVVELLDLCQDSESVASEDVVDLVDESRRTDSNADGDVIDAIGDSALGMDATIGDVADMIVHDGSVISGSVDVADIIDQSEPPPITPADIADTVEDHTGENQ